MKNFQGTKVYGSKQNGQMVEIENAWAVFQYFAR
jgi:hypothetical protein